MSTETHVGIVIVNYNRSSITNLCLESLIRSKNKALFTVFLVDNASQSSDVERLDFFVNDLQAQSTIDIDYHKSEKNLGFSGGNNIGIRAALAKPEITHICLLNNDTLVPDGWLDDLCKESKCSLVGPVSNSVGNEQVIPVEYTPMGINGYTINAVRSFAQEWRNSHFPNVVASKMLGFFCVLGDRFLFERVGELDENFGIGTYEDDDFCLRVLNSGLELKIVRHCFVHHWGSASFSAIPSASLIRLMNRNKKYFETKHQTTWIHPTWTLSLALLHELQSPQKNPLIVEKYMGMIKRHTLFLQEHFDLYVKSSLSEVVALKIHSTNVQKNGFWGKLGKLTRLIISSLLLAKTSKTKSKESFDKDMAILRGYFVKVKQLIFSSITRMRFKIKTRSSKKPTAILFSNSKIDFRTQRPLQLAYALANNGYEVLWIEPATSPYTRRFGSYYSRIFSKGITTVSISELPEEIIYTGGLTPSEGIFVSSVISKFFNSKALKKAHVIVTQSFWVNAAKALDAANITYDCMDLHEGFESATRETCLYESLLLKTSDQILASSTYIKNKIKNDTNVQKIHLLRNGCDTSKLPLIPLESSAPKIVGYFGAIAEWFDVDLLIFLAKSKPEWRFEILGDYSMNRQIKNLKSLPSNICLYGEVKFIDLPKYVKNWSVATIPFRITPLIEATNPVKLYEYAALGLPCVSTKIPEVLAYSNELDVKTSNDYEEFLTHLERHIHEDTNQKRLQRRHFSEGQTWQHRAEELTTFWDHS